MCWNLFIYFPMIAFVFEIEYGVVLCFYILVPFIGGTALSLFGQSFQT